MSKDKPAGLDAETALHTLDQLSQTIEVMSDVVNRLRRHLSRQLRLSEQQQDEDHQEPHSAAERKSRLSMPDPARDNSRANVELEMTTYRRRMSRGPGRVIH